MILRLGRRSENTVELLPFKQRFGQQKGGGEEDIDSEGDITFSEHS